MQIVSKEAVARQLAARKAGEFTDVIGQLEKGSALCISPAEWKKRTSIPLYFLGRFNRGKKTVSVLNMGEYYYVVKL